jgi:hypothetical protein
MCRQPPTYALDTVRWWLAPLFEPFRFAGAIAQEPWQVTNAVISILILGVTGFLLGVWRWSDHDALEAMLDTMTQGQATADPAGAASARDAVLLAFDQPGMVALVAARSSVSTLLALLIFVGGTSMVLALLSESWNRLGVLVTGSFMAGGILCIGFLLHTLLYFVSPTAYPPTSLIRLCGLADAHDPLAMIAMNFDLFSIWYCLVVGIIGAKTCRLSLGVSIGVVFIARLIQILCAMLAHGSALLSF